MIRPWREEKGLTQCELAELLEVDQTAISQWERGRAKPRADKLLRLAEILGCTVEELLREESA